MLASCVLYLDYAYHGLLTYGLRKGLYSPLRGTNSDSSGTPVYNVYNIVMICIGFIVCDYNVPGTALVKNSSTHIFSSMEPALTSVVFVRHRQW